MGQTEGVPRQGHSAVSFDLGAGIMFPLEDEHITHKTWANTGTSTIEEQVELATALTLNGGVLWNMPFNERWSLTVGLQYYYRRTRMERDPKAVTQCGTYTTMRNLDNAVTRDYTYNNVELPVMLGYSVKRTTIDLGFSTAVVSYVRSRYTYVVLSKPSYFYPDDPWISATKSVYDWKLPWIIFPTLKVSYDVPIIKVPTRPYLAAQYALNNHHEFYCMAGIEISLKGHHNPVANE